LEKLSLLQLNHSQQEEIKMAWSPSSSTSGWKPNWDIAGVGGSLFGGKDVSKALAQGATRAQIKDYMEKNPELVHETNRAANSVGAVESSDPAHTNLYDRVTTTDTGPSNQWGGSFYGGADAAFDRDTSLGDARASNIQIRDYIGNDPGSHFNAEAYHGGNESYQGTIDSVVSGAGTETNTNTNIAQGKTIKTLNTDVGTLQGDYKTLQSNYDTLTTDYKTLQSDVAQAAKDALKIKYTGSTAVQNPSAMGIQTAQGTPFKGSGLAGTAALARPNKGLKIKTLNV